MSIRLALYEIRTNGSRIFFFIDKATVLHGGGTRSVLRALHTPSPWSEPSYFEVNRRLRTWESHETPATVLIHTGSAQLADEKSATQREILMTPFWRPGGTPFILGNFQRMYTRVSLMGEDDKESRLQYHWLAIFGRNRFAYSNRSLLFWSKQGFMIGKRLITRNAWNKTTLLTSTDRGSLAAAILLWNRSMYFRPAHTGDETG